MRKPVFNPYANNKDADQSAHLRSLISVFVVHCLDQYNTCCCYTQNFKTLASYCSWAGLFESYLVANSRRQVFAWRGSNMKIFDVSYFPLLILPVSNVSYFPLSSILPLSNCRTCPTRSITGMSFVSSVSSVRRHLLINRSPPRMTRSSVPIAMTTTLLPGVMAVGSHLGEVSCHDNIFTSWYGH